MRSILSVSLLLICSLAWADASHSIVIAPGVTYLQEITNSPQPLVINLLKIDMHRRGVKVECGQADGAVTLAGAARGRETVVQIARREHALAGVNANFFPFTGEPIGLAIRNGALYSLPEGGWPCLGIGPEGARMDSLHFQADVTLPDGTALPITGLDHTLQKNGLTLFTADYRAETAVSENTEVFGLKDLTGLPLHSGTKAAGSIFEIKQFTKGAGIPPGGEHAVLLAATGEAVQAAMSGLKIGGKLTLMCSLIPDRLKDTSFWQNVHQGVSGGSWLLRDGKIYQNGVKEGFDKTYFVNYHHPRTAAGITRNGDLLLLTVDGRVPWSAGVSLDKLAAILQRFGAIEAMNMDGGGSTTMEVGGEVVNDPSDGEARPVAAALLVGEANQETAPRMSSDKILATGGNPMHLTAGLAPLTLQFDDTEDQTPVLWGTENGGGFVSQDGIFRSITAGTGNILARKGGLASSLKVKVYAGPVVRIKTLFRSSSRSGVKKLMLQITAFDEWGNPVPYVHIKVTATGALLPEQLITDGNGRAETAVKWNLSGGSSSTITLSVNKIQSKIKLP